MAPEIADDPAADDLFDRIPELPSLTNRWTMCPKAALVDAVRGDGTARGGVPPSSPFRR